MGRTKTSDSSSSSETSKKRDKQATSSKSHQNDSDSDSDVKPQVYPGTHWPLDSTLELLINYDAVKEIRAVKPDFYPMLFYLTKSDYSSVARVLSKLPVIMDHLQARLDKGKVMTESQAPVTVKPTQTPKTVTPTVIRDLMSAKEEILKLLSNMCLNQKDADELLDWFNSFETKRKGRNGFHLDEQEKIQHPKPVTRTYLKLDQKLTSERSIVTRAQEKHDSRPVNVKKQVKSDSKCVGTIKRPRKDASPEDKSRPPTREEIYENINKMAAAQILSKSDSVKTKKTGHCPEDKSQNQKIGTKKRGRPRIVKESDDETNSALESPSKRTKTKSRLCKSVSPSVSLHSPSPPLLSPQPTTSPSRFRLSMGNIQTLSDDIKCVLNNKIQQSSEVVKKYIGVEVKNINTGEEWSQHTPGPETLQGPQTPDPIQTQPIRSNFGPVPMCLYKVQTDTDETPMDNSLELVTPKIEIDIAEDESCGQCFVKVEPGLSTECSVTASGITQNSTPIIKTICTGPVCGGDNCMHEHSVIVEDCDNADTDCVQESFNQDAKEAEPVIIIDD